VREVLVVTGRGERSVDGVSVVRQGVLELLASLSRRHVVAAFREHTPGSVIVELAPFKDAVAVRAAVRPPAPALPDPRTLKTLSLETRQELRGLAMVHLQGLGVHDPTRQIVEAEMLRQFARLAATIPDGLDPAAREAALRRAVHDAVLDDVKDASR
jgi:hypothetical protein